MLTGILGMVIAALGFFTAGSEFVKQPGLSFGVFLYALIGVIGLLLAVGAFYFLGVGRLRDSKMLRHRQVFSTIFCVHRKGFDDYLAILKDRNGKLFAYCLEKEPPKSFMVMGGNGSLEFRSESQPGPQ